MSQKKSVLDRRQFLKSTSGVGLAMSLPMTSKPSAQQLPSDITSINASQLSAAIAAKQVRCIEVMQAYLERIHRYNPVYNALVSMLDDDQLLAQAKEADSALDRGEYWG